MKFEFSGKIKEVYFTDAELSTAAVIYEEDGNLIQFDLNVDVTDDRWNSLLEEVSLEEIDRQTRQFHENHRELFRVAFNDYAERMDMGGEVHVQELDMYKLICDLLNFDENDATNGEDLFKIKLAIFDHPKVKATDDKKKKTAIRRAKTPVEALLAFSKIK